MSGRLVATAVAMALLVCGTAKAFDASPGCAMLRTEEGDILVGPACTLDFLDDHFDVTCTAGECDVSLSGDVMLNNTSVTVSQLPAAVWMTRDGTAPTTSGTWGSGEDIGTTYSDTRTNTTGTGPKVGLQINSTGTLQSGTPNYGLRCSATGGTTNVCFFAADASIWQAPGATFGVTDIYRYMRTNSANAAQTSNLNPGVLFWYTAGFGAYGADIGHNGTAHRARLFGASNACLSTTTTTVDDQTDFTDQLCVTSGPNLQWGNTTSTSFSWTLNGNAARSIGLARHATASSAGSNLTVQAGGPGTNSDLAGGDLILASGQTEGNGASKVDVQTVVTGQGTGTTDRNPATQTRFRDGHIVTLGTAPSLGSCGTSPTIVGNDVAGKVTIGSGGSTACVVTFTKAFTTNAPICIAQNETASARVPRPTTSTTALTLNDTLNASDVIAYQCLGRE